MALGTMTSVAAHLDTEHFRVDEVTLVGDDSYPTGGSTGLKAKLQALRADGRVPVAVLGSGVNGNYQVRYDANVDKLILVKGTAGADAEESNGTNTSGTTLKLIIISK